ncbi:uncharacterized protein J4E84_004280 [Alternaria hordeiaustralica]|uniref:uncharacterized protein n=1 Tax=Alternaria hordeiaustralica TaxID=1187925 RepID=UPI0020C21660|nr:uncharacterized protein J4E84_004280 [Alternaria hordeiaustralica]KAI4690099.1 hypothetical protein J4E84_004280 [Alternaria hordeiaustralica]
MSRPSTVAARCAALGTSIAQVIPDVSSFARKFRDARHDLNKINSDLLVIRTGLSIAQDDFSAKWAELPASLIDAVSRVLDSCDDTCERLHKAFLKLSCGSKPKEDWRVLKDGPLVNLRHDLDASKVVLELCLDYVALFSQQDTMDSLLQNFVSDLITQSDELLKKTDTDEIYLAKRTTLPRPDSLEPALGEEPRSGRKSPHEQASTRNSANDGIGTWLANVPSFEDAQTLSYSALEQTSVPRRLLIPPSREDITPSRGTFYTDDGAASSPTLVPPESRLKKSYSWCTDLSGKANVSIFHRKITSDRIAVTKGKRKELEPNQRAAVDRILANIPAEATAAEVERVIWEGANPMATHPEFGYFFIRVAYEMSPDILTLLLDFGADITRVNPAPSSYYSAMHAATLGRQLATVRYLASLGHSIDNPDHDGETPLHLACRTPGASAIAKYLVEAGVDVNFEAKSGRTPLQSALKAVRLEGKERSMLIELLQTHGAEGEVKRDLDCGRGNEKGRHHTLLLTTCIMTNMEKAYKMWVEGKEVEGRAEQLAVEDPATGEIFAHCHAASEADVENVVKTAHKVFKSGVWSKAPRHVRADTLDRIAELLTKNLPRLIALEVQQTGRAIREMNAQVPTLTKWFKYYAALIRTEERSVLPTVGKLHNWVDRKPLGVVAQITPFNHPMLIAVKKIAPALAAGNSIVLKPSELTPLTSIELGKLLKEAGLPDGVFSVLPGDGITTGKALVEHPLIKKVDVTGGTPAGRAIGAIAGRNLAHYTAELGGKAPLIVFEKAHMDLAVNGIVFASFIASGQTCVAATRIIVQNNIIDQVVEKLKAKVQSIERRMGSPKNVESMMGPLISAKQLSNVETLVNDAKDAGATVVTGGQRMTHKSSLDDTDFSKGYFYPPTILADSTTKKIVDTRIWKEEAFGPVIVVVGFDTEEEALELANDSEFGLGAAIWTQDLSQAFRVSESIESGICWVNTHHRNDPSSPWGGIKSSGVGSENGIDAYNAYTASKSTIINYATADEGLASDDWFREGAGEVRYG